MKHWLVAFALLILAAPAHAACALPGQTPMLVTRLYFGQDEESERTIAPGDWEDFVERVVTPRFPDGFTVYDGHGEWRDRKSRRTIAEPSKVLEIAAPDTAALHRRVAEIARLYKQRFHQQSVGLVTVPGCGSF